VSGDIVSPWVYPEGIVAQKCRAFFPGGEGSEGISTQQKAPFIGGILVLKVSEGINRVGGAWKEKLYVGGVEATLALDGELGHH
jgi:hypothetical protein